MMLEAQKKKISETQEERHLKMYTEPWVNCAVEVKTPSEPHLLYLLKALRDRLDSRSIDALWWLDARDMICDAMTKGTLPREPLLPLWRTATLQIHGETPVQWRSSVQRPKGLDEVTEKISKMTID